MKILWSLLVFTLLMASLSGCSMHKEAYAGLGMDIKNEGLQQNPYGHFGVRARDEHKELYIEHRSSIPNRNDGWGHNEVGARILFNLQ